MFAVNSIENSLKSIGATGNFVISHPSGHGTAVVASSPSWLLRPWSPAASSSLTEPTLLLFAVLVAEVGVDQPVGHDRAKGAAPAIDQGGRGAQDGWTSVVVPTSPSPLLR